MCSGTIRVSKTEQNNLSTRIRHMLEELYRQVVFNSGYSFKIYEHQFQLLMVLI